MELRDYEIIMDSLRTIGIYVIREDDHRILYFSKKVKEMIPEIKQGMVCHDLWAGSCLKCPILQIGDRQSAHSVDYDHPLGHAVEITANRIMWEDRIPAFSIIIRAFGKSDNIVQKESARDDTQIAAIIRSMYETMNTVYLDTGKYEQISLHGLEDLDVHMGNYEYHLEKIIWESVHEEDMESVFNMLSLANLRRKAAEIKDVTEIVFQHRIIRPHFKWMEEHLIFIPQRTGMIVNILSRDVTGEKHKEAVHAREIQERNHIVSSINSLFFATYYLNLEKDTYKMVTQVEGVGNILREEKKCTEAFRLYARHFVHPQDRKEYLEKMNCENFCATLSTEHPFFAVEYRRIIVKDGEMQNNGWVRATVVLSEAEEGRPKRALYVAQDVTEIKEKEKRERRILKDACDAARHANAARNDFLSKMSHDIKTPMNAIIGMTEVARQNPDDQGKVADCLNKIADSGRHLLALINEVLDMSKIGTGRMELKEEAFCLTDMLRDLTGMAAPDLQEKRHELTIDTDEAMHDHVVSDADKLRQVFANLLSNAVKFTPPGGKIRIGITEKPSHIYGYGSYEFVFQDNGIGMQEDFVKRVFEPFSRVEDSRVSSSKGTGLGLAIASNIVHMMGGDIRVESRPGEGSRFTVVVTLKQQENFLADKETGVDVPVQAEDREGSDCRESCRAEEYGQSQRQDFGGSRILVVDDNELNREIAEEIIGNTGAAVESTANGRQALEKFESSPEGYYDMIFMDIHMPEKDGLEATRALRRMEREDAKKIPVIAMTANTFAGDVLDSRKAGMNEHMTKPFEIGQLLACMRRWISRKD